MGTLLEYGAGAADGHLLALLVLFACGIGIAELLRVRLGFSRSVLLILRDVLSENGGLLWALLGVLIRRLALRLLIRLLVILGVRLLDRRLLLFGLFDDDLSDHLRILAECTLVA